MTPSTTSTPAVEPVFRVAWGSATATGRRRVNEDGALARAPIFLVADGMGGHSAGRDASACVVDAFDEVVTARWLTPATLTLATRSATDRVRELAAPDVAPPGSTVSGVGLALHDGVPSWLVFNIGDSRTYRLTGLGLEQVTVDHSRVQELIEAGIAAHTARASMPSNIITRAIGGGVRPVPRADQWLLPANEGDRVLVCSDGLSGEVSSALIEATLRSHAEPGAAASALVEAAVAAGGHDNITAVVVDALEVSGETADEPGTDTLDELSASLLAGDTVPDLPVVGGAP